jgi:phage-related protein
MQSLVVNKITFFKDEQGVSPIREYLKGLKESGSKDARIKLRKIQDYLNALRQYGTQVGEPVVKHLAEEIWELRPLRDRFLFAKWIHGGYVLLHHFVKKTRKTPIGDIKQAKRNLVDFTQRSKNNG